MNGGAAVGPPVLAAAFHFSPHQEHTMEISYPGYVVDTIVGQVTPAKPDGSRMVAVHAVFEAISNRTRVTFDPLPLDTVLVQDAHGFLRVAPERTDG